MAEPLRKRFTTAEYHAMAEAGILHEDDRVELIEGEIWQMTPIDSRHASAVIRLTDMLISLLAKEALVSVQNPVRLSDLSEPRPDVAVLRLRDDYYASQHPGPPDVLLLIEVAGGSLDYDRRVKTGLYARHGIAEVWLHDVRNAVLTVYRDPSPQGYRDVTAFHRGDRLSPPAFPDLDIEVSSILG